MKKSSSPNPRLSAIEALNEIFQRGSRPKDAIEEWAGLLDKRDRAFLMEMVYGVLRYRDTIDWILKHFLKNTAKLGLFTLNGLRVAAYQLLFMRVPDWAVVSESVEIEKQMAETGRDKHSLVNAVLRNIIRKKELFTPPLTIEDPVSSISVNTSHPEWLIKRWISRLGEEEAISLAKANNQIPPMTIRTNTLRTSRSELIDLLSQNGITSEPTVYSPDGILLEDVRNYGDLSFAQGLFAVQDEASQLVSLLLAPRQGERVLDACAAPGGKTTHIAQLMRGTGEIIAMENDRERISRLTENVKKLGAPNISILNADITEASDLGVFDRVLLDAPCSALGVIRRNPDIKYRRSAKDLMKFRSTQTGLLRSAARLLKPGGTLVYSVCSTEPEEGDQPVTDFLKSSPEFRIIEDTPILLKDFMETGFFRTYPHKNNMDGFFGVSLCKIR